MPKRGGEDDERVTLAPLYPEAALRALLSVDPDAESEEDEGRPKRRKKAEAPEK